MKTTRPIFRFLALSLALVTLASPARAVLFTSNAVIGPDNTFFDGDDLSLSNCTVTVDGPHSFASIHVLNGGVLTHSFSTNGFLANRHVGSEVQVLTGLSPSQLNQPYVLTNTLVVSDASNVYTQGVDYVSFPASQGFYSLQRLAGSAIPDGGTVFVAYDAQVPAGLYLTVTNNVEVEPGGAIDVTGGGYGPGIGSGAGASSFTNFPYPFIAGSGAGYGGLGGPSSSLAAGGASYGSVPLPASLGSGGGSGSGPGGAGGGLIQITAGAVLLVNGRISAGGANGLSPHSGGGSGGTIWLSAHVWSGNGTITANGGAGEPFDGGGAAGGRIAIYYASDLFTGALTALGGAGATYGGAGTIYTQAGSGAGAVMMDNGGPTGASTPYTTVAGANLTIGGGAVGLLLTQTSVGNLLVNSNGWFGLPAGPGSLSLFVTNNATIRAGGGIRGDGRGYGAGQGLGAGVSGAGAGHGGYGGASGNSTSSGNVYDSAISPNQFGSGGGSASGLGGAGGGVVSLNVAGMLSMDGSISVNGNAAPGNGGGGGSGGAVSLAVGRLAGAGSISANGGSGDLPIGGGGAGGRIAIVCTSNTFTGTVSARGANGANAGAAGTIYVRTNNAPIAQLLVDNGGLRGTNTPTTAGDTFDLTARGGAAILWPASGTVRHLFIGSNSLLTAASRPYSLTVSISGNVTIEAGGSILLDGWGAANGSGPGAGLTVFTTGYGNTGGGGGEGGYGGASAFGAQGGNVSGSVSSPAGSYGSSGGLGNGNSPNNQGGAGGAAFSLTTPGALQLDGLISVNGMPGVGQWSGGGSGGSIQLSVGNFSGAGRLSAIGGAGDAPYGGGGGGGRIALSYVSTTFSGTMSAIGGSGATAGGAGTIYLSGRSVAYPTILVDNGRQRGTNTLLSAPNQCELLVTGGAQLLQGGSNPFVNLFIGSNSVFTWPSPFTARTVTVTSNLVIQAGGKITLDAQGNNQQGTGSFGSGAGFGGYGGRANTNNTTFPGTAYGSVFSESGTMGSAAGSVVLGGGGLTLNVTRTLLLDGSITANGSNAPLSLVTQFSPSAGGGSGGGITLSAALLTGSGTISANGGDGTSQGGGGGGGRITITASNQFTGTISARGGAGFNYGGAGTIYFAFPKIDPKTIEVVLDNGGFRGTNTPVSLSGTYNLTVSGGALGQIQLGTSQPNFRNLLVASNSTLTVTSSVAGGSQSLIGSNFVIQAGGVLNVDGLGNVGSVGSGPGITLGSFGGGGGYGGFGGNASNNAAGGNSFGSISVPIDLGCGGGGPANTIRSGAGGGAVTLTANGTVQVDGRLSADGTPALLSGGGGGSGGSLRLSARRFLGSGIISASGGAGLAGGGGGAGGRIALTYSNNQFTGSIFARGGIAGTVGASSGGAGTIYLKASNSPIAQVVVDNGGLLGTNTPITSVSTYDLVVKSGTAVSLLSVPNGTLLNSLVIQSNSQLIPSTSGVQIRVNSNAVIEAGGAIVVDGKGAAGGQGSGVGRSSSTSVGVVGGGGGHGGFGGSAAGAAGGDAYGSVTSPTTTGSGGGAGTGTSTNNLGGAGGGIINLVVYGTLTLDGRLGADGLPGVGQWSGGGSGGSIAFAAGTLLGSGTVSANGGAGDPPYGGGGAGGRISCWFGTNQFQGRFVAKGGPGNAAGGAGTVYLKNSPPGQIIIFADRTLADQVLVDNGGQSGTNTPLPNLNLNNFDLTVGGGAIVNPTNGTIIRNLLVGSNAWLSAAANQTTNLQLVVTSNAVLQAGGGINLDGKGLGGGLGTGVGGFSTGGGGAYGGNGGAAGNSPQGGLAYGSLLQPAQPGSGGGGSPLIVPPLIGPLGGAGGGAVRLSVSNSLVVDGQITANGLTGTLGGGGGSGGAIWLSVGSFSGSGSISAIGGPGDLPSGGGGGGGRLALYVSNNQFTGAISTRGGSGANAGGAGTIYLRTNATPAGLVLVDNGGLAGTNTPLSSPETLSLSLAGRAVASPSTPNLQLSGLVIDSGANLTQMSSQSNLDVIVLGSATIGSNGFISVNAKGFSGAVGGPGAGQQPSSNDSGSGGGYGGAGGASASGVPGGTTYGSATQPVERGSRGGLLLASDYPSFSQGGGAVRLRVSQTLTVNGLLTANGNDALRDRTGGGSGGSIWVTARTLEGRGFIMANGGSGEPVEGGGGGGGRIALNTRTNHFAGLAIAAGGYGANWGANGTVVITNIPAPQVIAQNPADVAFYAVSNVDVTFSSLMNPATAGPTDFLLNTPDGLVPQAEQSVAALDLSSFRLSFDPLDTIGYYELSTGPNIEDIYGVPMAATSIGSFVIFPPTISGQVTDTNGLPVPFVTMRAGSDFLPVVTDVHGNYSIEVTPGWSGTVTPSKGIAMFVPGSRTYANIGNDLTNQNFVMVSPVSLLLTSEQQGSNLKLGCYGINGVTYQMQYSTNLVDWIPYGSPIVGSNCQMTISAPLGNEPKQFFRFVTSY